MIVDAPIQGAATLYSQTGDLFTWLTALHSGSSDPSSARHTIAFNVPRRHRMQFRRRPGQMGGL